MARPSSPWYRAECDAWYVCRNGKQVRLCKGKANKKEAYRRFLELEDEPDPDVKAERVTARQLSDAFLDHAQSNLKPRTWQGYERFLKPFIKTVSQMDANQIQPKHVTAFLDSKKRWGKTTRFNAITAIKRAWKWAKDEGHITLNQIAHMKRPRPEVRTEIPTEEEIALFLRTAKPAFRKLLDFIHNTGCRPGEAAMIEKRHVDLANREVRFKIGEDKTSGKTGKARVIHLSDTAHAILAGLIDEGISGPLFRNAKGHAWTGYAMACAVSKIRKRTGLDSRAVVYALRHNWATDALAQGVPLATVAEMMGNSPEVVARVYSHLSDKKSLLMNAANAVRPSAHC